MDMLEKLQVLADAAKNNASHAIRNKVLDEIGARLPRTRKLAASIAAAAAVPQAQ